VFAFPHFPFIQPNHLDPHPIPLSACANCIPSVHMSTALLVVWFSRRWRSGLILSLIYLALIVVATLGSGEHYLFDLVVAIPYTFLIFRLGKIEWRLSEKNAVDSHLSQISM
jgi:hypothetical protein